VPKYVVEKVSMSGFGIAEGGGWQIPTSEKKSCGGVVQGGDRAQQRLTHPAKRQLTTKCVNDGGSSDDNNNGASTVSVIYEILDLY
jgi:hypothetical protein